MTSGLWGNFLEEEAFERSLAEQSNLCRGGCEETRRFRLQEERESKARKGEYQVQVGKNIACV